jgi:hypothetical protein
MSNNGSPGRRFAALCLMTAVVLAGCTGGGGGKKTVKSKPKTVELPATPVKAALTQTFASKGATFDPAKLFPPGSVEANWYISGGSWVVFYKGLDLSQTGALCPGNSIKTATGFAFGSDSPTEAGACNGVVSKVASAPVGVRLCGIRVLYLTAIPATESGTLYGTIEKGQPDGSVQGMTSQAPSSTSAPKIDLDKLGCTQVTPAKPLTKEQAATVYLAAVAPVNAAAAAFITRTRTWTSSTPNGQAVTEAQPLNAALSGVHAKLVELGAGYTPAAAALKADADAAQAVLGDLTNLVNLNRGLTVAAWTQQFNADLAKLTAASNAVRAALGLPPPSTAPPV